MWHQESRKLGRRMCTCSAFEVPRPLSPQQVPSNYYLFPSFWPLGKHSFRFWRRLCWRGIDGNATGKCRGTRQRSVRRPAPASLESDWPSFCLESQKFSLEQGDQIIQTNNNTTYYRSVGTGSLHIFTSGKTR